MPICKYCGQTIVFRHVGGRVAPIHVNGNWCPASGSAGSVPEPRPSSFEDVCRITNCPKCGKAVYFIRHNGGSIWVDALGWPWPKHECFDNEKKPAWYGYFLKKQQQNKSDLIYGVVVRAVWRPRKERRPSHIVLLIDAGKRGKIHIATEGTTTPEYLDGEMLLIDLEGKKLTVSNSDIKPIWGSKWAVGK